MKKIPENSFYVSHIDTLIRIQTILGEDKSEEIERCQQVLMDLYGQRYEDNK